MVDQWKRQRVEDIGSATGAPTDRTSEPDSSEARPGHLLLDIRCLGSFEIYRRNQLVPPEMFPRRDALTLLKILLLHRGRPVPYDQLAEMLQPEADPDLAVNRLHVLVHTLRRLLEPSAQRPWLFIRNRGGGYYFNRDAPHRLDVQTFLDSIELGERLQRKNDVAKAIDAFEMAISLYRGDLFEDDPYAAWCWEDREVLREGYLDALDRLAGLYLEQGVTERSMELSRTALKTDALRERMHLRLIKALWLEGRPAEALRQYEVCRDILQRELRTTPCPEIEQLARNIRNSAPA
jgi:DNA-binding SARP family transcriptional activator